MGTYVSTAFQTRTWNSGMIQSDWTVLLTNFAAGMTGCGLVQTSDTGQVDPTTSTMPVQNTNAGYLIYRFADSVQGTDPIYIKAFVGRSNSNGVVSFRVQLQIGQGSNGSGTLTGSVSDTLSVNTGAYNVTNTSLGTTYAYHGEGVAWITNYGNFTTQNYPPLNYFCIARTRNQVTGAFDGRGVLVHYMQYSENRSEQYFYNWTSGRKHQSAYGTYQYCIPVASQTTLPSGDYIAWPHFYMDDGVVKKAWATWTVVTSQLAAGVNTLTASPYGSPRTWFAQGTAGKNIRGLGVVTSAWSTILPWE